jgi:hypothetical protein
MSVDTSISASTISSGEDLSSGVGALAIGILSLDDAPLADTPGMPATPAQIVSGLTHELCVTLPSGPLVSWSVEDVSTCLRVLGRDFVRNEGNATDVSVFDTAAESCQLDGTKLVQVTGDSLRALGFTRYDHRASIMDWVRQHLEVRPDLTRTPKLKHTAGVNFFPTRTSPYASRQTAPTPSQFHAR